MYRSLVAGLCFAAALASCSSEGTEADKYGVGAQCTVNGDCKDNLECLPFKGGYCGLAGCLKDADCPDGSACVSYVTGQNYCFLICIEKPDCNRNRSVELESNCSSNVTFTDGAKNRKACVPPSGT